MPEPTTAKRAEWLSGSVLVDNKRFRPVILSAGMYRGVPCLETRGDDGVLIELSPEHPVAREIRAGFNNLRPLLDACRDLLLALPDCGPSRCGRCPTCRMEDAITAAERDLGDQS